MLLDEDDFPSYKLLNYRPRQQFFFEREAKTAQIHRHLANDELCRCGDLRRHQQWLLVGKLPGARGQS